MLIFIVAEVILLICIVIQYIRDTQDWRSRGFNMNAYDKDTYVVGFVVISLFIFFFSVVVSLSIIPAVVDDPSSINYEVDTTKIVALEDNVNVKGRMSGGIFLVGGQVNSELYYYYMEETPRGYTSNKIPAKNCYIHYTDSSPRIENHYGVSYKKWIYNALTMGEPQSQWYEIYVPEGTISGEYNIDLE